MFSLQNADHTLLYDTAVYWEAGECAHPVSMTLGTASLGVRKSYSVAGQSGALIPTQLLTDGTFTLSLSDLSCDVSVHTSSNVYTMNATNDKTMTMHFSRDTPVGSIVMDYRAPYVKEIVLEVTSGCHLEGPYEGSVTMSNPAFESQRFTVEEKGDTATFPVGGIFVPEAGVYYNQVDFHPTRPIETCRYIKFEVSLVLLGADVPVPAGEKLRSIAQ